MGGEGREDRRLTAQEGAGLVREAGGRCLDTWALMPGLCPNLLYHLSDPFPVLGSELPSLR